MLPQQPTPQAAGYGPQSSGPDLSSPSLEALEQAATASGSTSGTVSTDASDNLRAKQAKARLESVLALPTSPLSQVGHTVSAPPREESPATSARSSSKRMAEGPCPEDVFLGIKARLVSSLGVPPRTAYRASVKAFVTDFYKQALKQGAGNGNNPEDAAAVRQRVLDVALEALLRGRHRANSIPEVALRDECHKQLEILARDSVALARSEVEGALAKGHRAGT